MLPGCQRASKTVHDAGRTDGLPGAHRGRAQGSGRLTVVTSGGKPMSASASARKLVVYAGCACRPIVTRSNIGRAVKGLRRRYGRDLTGIDAAGMSQRERDELANELIRIAYARYRFGLEPFYPIEPEDVYLRMPYPYLTNQEVLLMGALVEATAQAQGYG